MDSMSDMMTSMAASAMETATATITSMAMATTSSMSMDDMSGMDMGTTSMDMTATSTAMDMSSTTSSSMDMSSSSSMSMLFHTSYTESLFASGWTPSTNGKYAGACIFLIVLAVVYRCVHVVKFRTEKYFVRCECRRGGHLAAARSSSDSESEKPVRSRHTGSGNCCSSAKFSIFDLHDVRPWRLSVEVPLALLQVLLSGIGYLLMLAVMTFNVGYFLSVLGGLFLGELVLGRYAANFQGH
ncbi:Ctr copper transporter family-domain-containing protein [Dipodascopsis tothii]|uniref:Ctr copper transporter family-domain-containing protein n=1 Tax=Dipodascopsis tothii TaxID=44089 RepID=UPI0034CF531A